MACALIGFERDQGGALSSRLQIMQMRKKMRESTKGHTNSKIRAHENDGGRLTIGEGKCNYKFRILKIGQGKPKVDKILT